MLAAILRQAMPRLPELSRLTFPPPCSPVKRITIDFTVRNFQVKTISSSHELRQILALRRSVFHHEFAGKRFRLRSDKDEFDDSADHLAIFDLKANQVAGVYRLINSDSECPFYSASEYEITSLLALPGRKLELSRACIRREYRNGAVIALLWRGLAGYAAAARADYLFGLSSINTMDIPDIVKVHQYFQKAGLIDGRLQVKPRDKYRIAGLTEALAGATANKTNEGEDLVPSLLKTYIKAGAKICSQPVIDREFRCADWLTMLEMRQIATAFGRRFMSS